MTTITITSKVDLLPFIKRCYENYSHTFQDFLNDTRERGQRDVFYIFQIKKNGVLVREGKINIIDESDLKLDKNDRDAHYLELGRNRLLEYSLNLITNHSVDITDTIQSASLTYNK